MCLHFGTVRQAAADLEPFPCSALTDTAALLYVELLDRQETDIVAAGHIFHSKPDTGLLTAFVSLGSVEDLHIPFVFYNLIIYFKSFAVSYLCSSRKGTQPETPTAATKLSVWTDETKLLQRFLHACFEPRFDLCSSVISRRLKRHKTRDKPASVCVLPLLPSQQDRQLSLDDLTLGQFPNSPPTIGNVPWGWNTGLENLDSPSMAAPLINPCENGTFCRFLLLLFFSLSHTNHFIVCCRMQLWANSANKNRHIHLTFPSHKWNIVNSDVMSFLAPNPDSQAKWNAAHWSGEQLPTALSLCDQSAWDL